MSSLDLARPRAPGFSLPSLPLMALALLAGGLLPLQAAMNAQLARSLQSVPIAALLSYLVGTATLMVVLLAHRAPLPHWQALRKAPPWALLAGVFGTWYVSATTLVISSLGATQTLGLVVAGQAVAGLVVDHHGWLGVPRQRLGPRGCAAMGLFLAALALLPQTR